MRNHFPSRKGPVVGVLYLALASLLFFLLGLPAMRGGNAIPLCIWLLILVVLGTSWFGINYVIEEGNLIVKIGPFTERVIPIDEISTIHRSYEFQASASGPSLKKLKVRFKGGYALITPGPESEFLEALTTLNPKIYVDLTISSSI